MKQSIQTIIKIILLALIGLTVLFLFIPLSSEIPKVFDNPDMTKDDNEDEDAEAAEITLRDPAHIAVLFGYVIPTPTPTARVTPRPTQTPVPTPVTPGWLKHTGRLVDEKIEYYLFKDERYNTPVKVAKGHPDKGWYFVKETSSGFHLKKDGIEYFVPRNR